MLGYYIQVRHSLSSRRSNFKPSTPSMGYVMASVSQLLAMLLCFLSIFWVVAVACEHIFLLLQSTFIQSIHFWEVFLRNGFHECYHKGQFVDISCGAYR